MTEKEYNAILELAIKGMEKQESREEIISTFVAAGIMDETGKLLPGYEGIDTLLRQ